MKKSLYILVPFALMVVLSGCLKRNCNCDPDPADRPPVVFQYEFVNYAWGYRHHGFLIDSAGRIMGFRQPEKWIFPDSSGFLSKEELEHNVLKCDTLCGTIESDILDYYHSKISDIRVSPIIDHGMIMADAGTGILSAWHWNDKAKRYESVFLVSNGDLYRENSHPATKEVVEWLKSIGEKTNRFYWYGQN